MKPGLALAFAVAALMACGPAVAQDAPSGWRLSGATPGKYKLLRSADAAHSGRFGASLSSSTGGPDDYGSLVQTVDAAAYRGKRVRLAAWMSTRDAASVQMWLRIDGLSTVLAMDNMDARPVKGTTPWTRYAIVLDAPDQAEDLAFGVFLMGTGSLRVDDFELAVVTAREATTPHYSEDDLKSDPRWPVKNVLEAPANLGFED